ncbi:MAG: pilin [Patescibacteria group bacterium]
MRRFFIFTFLFAVLLLPLISLAAPNPESLLSGGDGGLVPNYTEGSLYGACDLITLGNNVISFGIAFSVIIATLMFAYAGILYVTAAGKGAEQVKKAHSIFVNVFIGLFIVLISWLLVDIGFSVLTGRGLAFWTDLGCSRQQSQTISGATPVLVSTNPQSGVASGVAKTATIIPLTPTPASSMSLEPRGATSPIIKTSFTSGDYDAQKCSDTLSAVSTYSEGITLLKQLVRTCSVEVFATFTEYTLRPGTWSGFTTGGSSGVILSPDSTGDLISSELDAAMEKKAVLRDYGSVYLVHTHPGVLGKSYLPPSLNDVQAFGSLVAKAIAISPDFASHIKIAVVAPDGLWTLDVSDFARKYTQPFTPQDGGWTDANLNAFLAVTQKIDTAVVTAVSAQSGTAYRLQQIYVGDVSSDGTITRLSTASDTEKEVAVQELLKLYKTMGVRATLTPWQDSI